MTLTKIMASAAMVFGLAACEPATIAPASFQPAPKPASAPVQTKKIKRTQTSSVSAPVSTISAVSNVPGDQEAAAEASASASDNDDGDDDGDTDAADASESDAGTGGVSSGGTGSVGGGNGVTGGAGNITF